MSKLENINTLEMDYYDKMANIFLVNQDAVCDSQLEIRLDESVINEKINKIEKEYENKLQRQKVHISRRDRITGRRIYGRRYKVTISKGLFRNKKGIVSCPTKS